MAPASANRIAALRVMAMTSGSTGVIPRLGEYAIRFGLLPERTADKNDETGAGSDNGSAGGAAPPAPERSPRSSTLRAIGPCTPRLRSILAVGVCATRPMLGRMPTMPQKLAGLRSDPPMSEPWASQAMPVASATAAPPEEPAADRETSHGLRVAPNTSL